MKIAFGGATDRGRSREHNEDSLVIMEHEWAMAVFDGVGGLEAGDRASLLCAETMRGMLGREAARENLGAIVSDLPLLDTRIGAVEARMIASLRVANKRLVEARNVSPDLLRKGMASTAVMAVFEEGVVHVVHVGDSRALLIRGEEISQITEDHSLVNLLVREGQLTKEEAAASPQKNVVMRALGSEERVAIDLQSVLMQRGDIVLACSDGLSDVVSPELILEIVRDNAADLDAAAQVLIAAANERGGPDNITVTIARVDDSGSCTHPDTARTVVGIPRESTEIANAEMKYIQRSEAATGVFDVKRLIKDEQVKRRTRIAVSVARAGVVLLLALLGAAGIRAVMAARGAGKCAVTLSLNLPEWAAASDSSIMYAVSVDGKLRPDSIRAGGQMLLTLKGGDCDIALMATDPCWTVDPPQPMRLSIERGQRVMKRTAMLKPMGAFLLFVNKGNPDSLWVMVNGVRRGPVDKFSRDSSANYLVPLCAGENEVRIIDAVGTDVVALPRRASVPPGTTTHVLTEAEGWKVSY